MIVCTSRDTCPTCRNRLWRKSMEIICYRTGYKKLSWTLYKCLQCGTTFKVYWPGRNHLGKESARKEKGS